jgi:hypothetical protein
LLTAMIVTLPAAGVGVWMSGEVGGTAMYLAPIFMIWFVGRATRIKRLPPAA